VKSWRASVRPGLPSKGGGRMPTPFAPGFVPSPWFEVAIVVDWRRPGIKAE
jgi:hypothetical protein